MATVLDRCYNQRHKSGANNHSSCRRAYSILTSKTCLILLTALSIKNISYYMHEYYPTPQILQLWVAKEGGVP